MARKPTAAVEDDALPDPAGGHWHLDKRVPVAMIIAMLLQAAVVLMWAVKLDSRVGYIEVALTRSMEDHEAIIRMDARLASIDRRLDAPPERR